MLVDLALGVADVALGERGVSGRATPPSESPARAAALLVARALVSDGDAKKRAQRAMLLDPGLRVAGVAIGSVGDDDGHAASASAAASDLYDDAVVTAVITLADGYSDGRPLDSAATAEAAGFVAPPHEFESVLDSVPLLEVMRAMVDEEGATSSAIGDSSSRASGHRGARLSSFV